MKTKKNGTITIFKPVPAGFNPLRATDAELMRRGLPRRPVEHPKLFQLWGELMQRPLRHNAAVFSSQSNLKKKG